ncbi:hypothetical protein [Leucothrix arctica]|uniref:Uncharacterized protein n=1 Tax=Leucothrix arctica TaxID=1481894 RepID=A0A317CBH8_9GAMM|nr:hypothetical protein [Leucothrix arctica]PWQ94663.1 hypothetical protein DKT75_15330 [Leucothrix arctica]
MKLSLTIGLLLSALLIQGCNAGPDTSKPIKRSAPDPAGSLQPKALSNTESKDQQFAELLQALENRNPNTEAQQAIRNGTPNVLGYYSGRGGLKVPGLTSEQQASQRCKLNTIDGLGDVIYGENHMKYRIAIRAFAKTYNSNMLAVCL